MLQFQYERPLPPLLSSSPDDIAGSEDAFDSYISSTSDRTMVAELITLMDEMGFKLTILTVLKSLMVRMELL